MSWTHSQRDWLLAHHSPHVPVTCSSPPPTPASAPPSADRRQLFVTQVPAVCDDAQLALVFAPFGSVVDAKVLRDGKGRSKGSALVCFEDVSGAQAALDGLHMQLCIPPHTSAVSVRYAVPQRQQQQQPPRQPTPQPLPRCGASEEEVDSGSSQGTDDICSTSPVLTPRESSGTASPPPPAPVKLFVGQLPKDYDSEHLRQLMQPYGEAVDIRVLRDASTGTPTGAAFCSFAEPSAAAAAIAALNGRATLPGMRTPLQVRYPEAPCDGTKLFVGQLPPTCGEADLRRLFEPFGEVLEAALVLDRSGASRRCAFVRYATLDAAQEATRVLHRRAKMDGSAAPLIVKTAARKQKQQLTQQLPVARPLHPGVVVNPVMHGLCASCFGYRPHPCLCAGH